MKGVGYFLMATVLSSCVMRGNSSPDVLKVSFEELKSYANTRIYNHRGIQEISQVAVDIPRHQIILGAKNYLIRLELDSLNELEVEQWKPSTHDLKMCEAKGQTQENCQNYVRVLLVHNHKLFACGTNAFSPDCTWRQAQSLGRITEHVQGVGKCPYHPLQNSSSLMLKNGDYFSATYTDFAGKDPAIYRIMGPSKPLRTVQQNSRWLNDPHFVSSYEIGEYIYFFFREMAVESKCEPGVYSRVARICKNDQGGNFLLEDNWTTFVKARLNCSLPGALPFAFNEIQSTYYDHREGRIHVAFTTTAPGIYGSAVCVYTMESLEKAFRGPFTYQQNAQMAWSRVTNNLPQNQCGSSSKRSAYSKKETPAQRVLMDAQKYQIMHQAIQPRHNQPYIVSENERYTHVVVDQVRTINEVRLEVIFLATLEGSIKKMVQLPGKKKACLIEEIYVTQNDNPKPIKILELLRGKDVLIVSTGEKVLKVPVYRCAKFNTKTKCINARDPYCGWNLASKKCMRSEETRSQNWEQDLSSCPVLKTPVDGGWSTWSKWASCEQVGRGGEQCKCRQRICNKPEPQYGGRDCSGASIEVSSCKVNGNWTPWSEWSGCTATCGSAQRYRKRSCSNPSPTNGGRSCDGHTADVEACKKSPACPLPPSQRARWAQWGSWSKCTHECAGGMKVRTRRCERPPVRGQRTADNDCVGNDQEWVGCNNKVCEEVRDSSTWSDWLKTNQTREGHIETRFQSVCVASVEGSHEMKSRLKTKIRFCPANSNHCTGDSNDEVEKGKYELTNHLPKDADHLDRFIEKYCKKIGYMNVKEVNNRINQFDGSNTDIFTEKLIKFGRRYGLARRGNTKRVNDIPGGGKKGNVKPDVYKINPQDGTAVASQRGLTHSSVFQGFCGCRDMGNLRMCYRCKQNPTKRSTKALRLAQKTHKANKKGAKESSGKKSKRSHNKNVQKIGNNNNNSIKKSVAKAQGSQQRVPSSMKAVSRSNLRSSSGSRTPGVQKAQTFNKQVQDAKKQQMRNHRKSLRQKRRKERQENLKKQRLAKAAKTKQSASNNRQRVSSRQPQKVSLKKKT